ncbi:acyl-CoA dehydrogenase [Telmatospirillum sp. J64-1]|uniref:acyl-CoA dehydrogenase n=1 Tax=Telmatospirillum sp. J64-1 TaxID=2502183 RepID=UPI00115E58C5|nr:acyl-CoA dehydrogenase [Telmatospirillum sp. J64-1]
MPDYTAPLRDMAFAITELSGLDEIAALPGYEDASPDLVTAVLEEAGKLGAEVLAPLNVVGDRTGCRLENGVVKTPDGFAEAYARFVEGGWNAVPFEPEHGGQGLPWLVATAVAEIWHSANMSFGLCPLLTQGAVEALTRHGSEELKALYLDKLVSGEWTGTMNLTEPQAGTDLAAIRTKAVPDGERWRLSGQKIFITYGDHDMAENIVHLVLARTPDAPPGVKGISLFVVPKFLVNTDGSLGMRNDARCIALEHKLGIHGSPTAVMAYGENEGAIGFLVGEENRGLEYMFTMMNNARLNVGLQGVSIAERAYQAARDYAKERVQGRGLTIVHHADVRRMLMSMKAQTEAARALTYYAAAAIDRAKSHPEPEARALWQATADLLIPVVKAWSTDIGIDVASTGIQVHGGMGYIEETGVAQYLRDARITAIYEGTNGIQAADLVGRKLLRDQGRTARRLLTEMRGTATALAGKDGDLAVIRDALSQGLDDLQQATEWLLAPHDDDPEAAAAGATPYLRLWGIVTGGWLMARAALAAEKHLAAGEDSFLRTKIVTARFFAEHLLPQTGGLLASATQGSGSIMALHEDQF